MIPPVADDDHSYSYSYSESSKSETAPGAKSKSYSEGYSTSSHSKSATSSSSSSSRSTVTQSISRPGKEETVIPGYELIYLTVGCNLIMPSTNLKINEFQSLENLMSVGHLQHDHKDVYIDINKKKQWHILC